MDTQKATTIESPGNGGHQSDSMEREDKLHHISHAVHAATNLDEILLGIKAPILGLFNAQALTIYAVDEENGVIYSKVKTGDTLNEIQIPISCDSIAGFVAQELKLLNIFNAHDEDELKKIHPNLEFDNSWDEKSGTITQSVLALPLLHENKLMGVLQLVNKQDEDSFNALDENYAFLLAETLALAICNQEKYIAPKPTKFSFLIENGFVSENELSTIMAKSRKSNSEVETLLMEELYLQKADIGKSLSHFYGLPYNPYDDSTHLPDPEVLGLEFETLKRQMWVPLELNDKGITALVHDPHDKDLLEKIRKMFPQQTVEFRVGLKSDIKDFLKSYGFPEPGEEKNPVLPEPPDSLDTSLEVIIEDDDINFPPPEKKAPAPTSPGQSAVDVFNDLIATSSEHGVTDIHIEPGGEDGTIRIRLRQDGVCRVYEELPPTLRDDLTTHIKTLAGLDPNQKQLPQRGGFRWQEGTAWADLDVVTYPTIGNVEDIMLQVIAIKRTPVYMSLEKMNFSTPNLERIQERIQQPTGMGLVVGSAGAGRTTTLHALAGNINAPEKKIITLEEPVEIIQNNLRQIQIDREAGLDYSSTLRTFLGSSPDALLVGDLSEPEAMGAGLEAASQFLVLSSLNAESPLECIKSILESGADPKMLGKVLSFIIGQKLVQTLCNECKEDYHPTREEFDELAEFYGKKYFPELGVEYGDDLLLKKPAGCKKCVFSGYAGHTGLHEVLEGTDDLKKLISKGANGDAIRKQTIKDGIITLAQDGIYKIFKGDCDFKQVRAAFDNS